MASEVPDMTDMDQKQALEMKIFDPYQSGQVTFCLCNLYDIDPREDEAARDGF